MNDKHPKQIPTPPFCIDCAHFISGDNGLNDVKAEHRCAKFPMLDLVTGVRFNMACSVIRSPDAPCGERGKLFQLKAAPSVEPEATGLN